ncbi:MAG TPA: ATP-binding protein [Verrucomicrobiae bacterium]|jgi:C4-dicarboxylate-specific signal transduction histidine kinase
MTTRFLRDTSIKRKMMAIITLTSCMALGLASIAFLTYERIVDRRTMVNELLTTARMAGDNSAAALSFNDPASAEQTLKSLSAHPGILVAAVYGRDGKVFAQYHHAGARAVAVPPTIKSDGYWFGDNRLELFHKIDLAGETAGTVYIQSDLEEMRARLWRYALIAVAVMLASTLSAFLLSMKLQALISEPISHLAHVAGVVAAEKNYSLRAVKRSEDELGRLIDGFNEMLSEIETRDSALQEARGNLERRVEERTKELRNEIAERKQAEASLEALHKELVEASRQAGMAEVATGVLHNVGNVLNSVNVSATLVADQLKHSGVTDLARVTALLREHAADLGVYLTADPKGRKVPAFLAQLSETLAAEHTAHLKELESLRKNIEHIKDIVDMQQSYAKVSGVRETVQVTDLVEDSLRLNAGALQRHGVQVERDYAQVPPITTEKHKVLQILVNLMRNAKYACHESGRSDKRLTVRVINGADRVRITVADNGVGIPPENLTRIFNHGFTTRRDGHGFGLHSGALAAKELGGSLSAQSEGPGRGAAFTLEVPCNLIAN